MGDLDGDGLLDVLTGSNCCAYNWAHWFRMSGDGKLSRRFDVKFSVEAAKYRISGKNESRPHVLDWNRDGFNDLVLILNDNQSSYNEETKKTTFRFAQRIFVDRNSESRGQRIRDGIVAKSKLPGDARTAIGMGGPDTAADLKVELDCFEDPELEKLARRQMSESAERRSISKHFEFVDFDQDGNFDIIFSDSKSEVREGEPGSGKTWQNYKMSDAIYWMRNLTRVGEPRFAPPIKIYDIAGKWRVTAFSVADTDGDGDLNAVVSVHYWNKQEAVSELWYLNAE